MNWQDEYGKKLVDIDEAVSRIQSGNDVIVAQCASEPQGCMSRFHIVADRVEDVRVFSVLTLKAYDFYMKPQMKGHFELASWFHAPGSREALKAGTGTVTYVPNMLHRAAADRMYAHTPDIFFGTCTPPDGHGYVSLSLGITYEKDVLEAARTVVLEVNPRLPRTFGDTEVHVSAVDLFVERDVEVPTLPSPTPSPTDLAIGGWIAELVENGSTIQLGIGGIPNAAALALRDKRDLGVHTEMLVDSVMELAEMGVVTNGCKGLLKGKFVCCFSMGSRKLYDWLNDNVAVQFERGRWVNDPAIGPAEHEDGFHQHLPHGGPHGPGGERVDRDNAVLGHGGPVRYRHRRRGGPGRQGQEHHRLLQHGQGRQCFDYRPRAARGHGSDAAQVQHGSRGHGARHRPPARKDDPRTREGPHCRCGSQLPLRPHGEGEGPGIPLRPSYS